MAIANNVIDWVFHAKTAITIAKNNMGISTSVVEFIFNIMWSPQYL